VELILKSQRRTMLACWVVDNIDGGYTFDKSPSVLGRRSCVNKHMRERRLWVINSLRLYHRPTGWNAK